MGHRSLARVGSRYVIGLRLEQARPPGVSIDGGSLHIAGNSLRSPLPAWRGEVDRANARSGEGAAQTSGPPPPPPPPPPGGGGVVAARGPPRGRAGGGGQA